MKTSSLGIFEQKQASHESERTVYFHFWPNYSFNFPICRKIKKGESIYLSAANKRTHGGIECDRRLMSACFQSHRRQVSMVSNKDKIKLKERVFPERVPHSSATHTVITLATDSASGIRACAFAKERMVNHMPCFPPDGCPVFYWNVMNATFLRLSIATNNSFNYTDLCRIYAK